MIVSYATRDLRGLLDDRRCEGERIGFVPTMGFLHEGHLSLVREAISGSDRTVVSIFVNPLQFGPGEDLDRYPRDLKRDAEMLAGEGVDYLFAPGVEELYPTGPGRTTVDPGRIGQVGEGRYRPGHFAGVATVCTKLFNIVGPCSAYFGQKDAQQVAVVRQVVNDLDLPVEVVSCPTFRDRSGLALSSRNTLLTQDQRRAAAAIHEGLRLAEAQALHGETDAGRLAECVKEAIGTGGQLKVQYVDVVDPESFEEVERVSGEAVIMAAVFAGDTRLIDNLTITAASS